MTKQLDFHKFQKNSLDVSKTSEMVNLSDIFKSNFGPFNENNLFMAHFKAIPNFITESDLNCLKAHTWFIEHYKHEIIDLYYCISDGYTTMLYFLYEDTIVHFRTGTESIKILFRKTPYLKINKIHEELNKFKRTLKFKPQISLLVTSKNGLELEKLTIVKSNLDLGENYNDDFIPVHNIILKRLSKKNDKGLILLHGKPGTGKTSYIRYLISKIKKKTVIFLPPDMATALTKPNLIPIFIENPNSIFVIEDAENIVIDRNKNGNSAVSALLNISDGLLSDCLNIQIICSFNTDVSMIDNALLRKGRLIAKYDFQDLKAEKATKLSNKLGFETVFHSPMPLCSIYNQEEENYNQPKKLRAIGF